MRFLISCKTSGCGHRWETSGLIGASLAAEDHLRAYPDHQMLIDLQTREGQSLAKSLSPILGEPDLTSVPQASYSSEEEPLS